MSLSSTSSSNRPALGRFCGHLAVFVAPVLGLVALFESAFWTAGESWPMSRIAAAHEGRTELLIRSQYFAQSYGFKFDRVRALKPEIICLGTSRVLQIRDLCFDKSKPTFYNGGGMLGSFADIHGYVQALHDNKLPRPKIVLIGLEPWWMKSGQPASQPTWGTDSQYADSFFIPQAHIAAMRSGLKQKGLLWPGAIGSAFSPARYSRYPALGEAALNKGVGFRIDGSYQYDPGVIIAQSQHPRYEDRETPPVIERILKRTEQFTPAQGIDQERLSQFVSDLLSLRGMGIEPLVILPPFSDVCYDELERDSTSYPWWQEYRTLVPQALNKASIVSIGPSSPKHHGMKDTTMWDGFHPSEVLMTLIVHELAMRTPDDSKIRAFISPNLDTLARSAAHPLTLEPDRFKP